MSRTTSCTSVFGGFSFACPLYPLGPFCPGVSKASLGCSTGWICVGGALGGPAKAGGKGGAFCAVIGVSIFGGSATRGGAGSGGPGGCGFGGWNVRTAGAGG